MARVCVDDTFFDVLPDGRLTFKPGSLGHASQTVFFGVAQPFDKSLYPDYARFHIRVIGAGGGGAGSVAALNESAVSGGGGGGGYAEVWLTWTQLAAIEFITAGAGGAGGVGNSDGVNGGASSFGTWAVANGGLGSQYTMTSATTPATVVGAGPGNATTIGGFGVPGGPGYTGLRLSALAATGGKGGDSGGGYGHGGAARSNNGTGAAGFGWGGGGAGAVAVGIGAASNQTGGAGSTGAVVVDVYF